ncbi:hypothetical protein KH5_19670 [Urechidicola sp. KH5]
MRKGVNPNKNILTEKNERRHQVIIPVFVPNHSNYFKDSFTILKCCLESLIITSNSQLFITIVDNGSCEDVRKYLQNLLNASKIQELIHTSNIGKFNAIVKGVSGHQFDFITIADADVLFMHGWLQKTYEVFNNFDKAGVVSTTPSSKMYKYLTANIIFKYIFSNKLKFTRVEDSHAMKMFADSVGNPDLYNQYHLNKYLTLEQNGCIAVVGAGHFVATYKSKVFSSLLNEKINSKLGKEIRLVLDYPAFRFNYFRLSTNGNYTYHMGNTLENWMFNKLEEIKEKRSESILEHNMSSFKNNTNIFSKFRIYIFLEFLLNKKLFLNFFLKLKGLTKEESNNY